MANFFHIADFENAFWSITPGVALKQFLYEGATVTNRVIEKKTLGHKRRRRWGKKEGRGLGGPPPPVTNRVKRKENIKA